MYRLDVIQIILIVIITLFHTSIPSTAIIPIVKTDHNALRPLSNKIQANAEDIMADIGIPGKSSFIDNAMPSTKKRGDNPQVYLSPNFTKAEWKKVLAKLGGPIMDISMEAIIPELGINALGGSRGGLGILEGDGGEGYAKTVWDANVSGIKAFITMPMYEYRFVPKTDSKNKKQFLEKEKVAYEKIIDFDNPVDYRILTDTDKFDLSVLKANGSKPIKILADSDGNQLYFKTKLYDERSGSYRDFKAGIFVTNRGGTPVFIIAHYDVNYALYPDDQSNKLNQQILIGKIAPQLYKKLGIKPSVMRINEAHTVIAMAEMIRDPYFKDTAFVFTNHTPIIAGLQVYFDKSYWFSRLGLPDVFEDKARNLKIDYKAIFINGNNLDFSRAAMILAQLVNGVSNAHGITLQEMFPAFKDKIRAILNGTGEFWKSDVLVRKEKEKKDISPLTLWNIHQENKLAMAKLIKDRTGLDIKMNEPVAIAIRRTDYYKQQYPMLKDIIKALCQDKGVKTKVLLNGKEEELEGLGMQVIVGGIIVDEHNVDLQYWIYEFISWMDDPDFQGRFIFVSGNDLELMKLAANGCDCWFEIPKRNGYTRHQEEACGTSGMRAVENGNIAITSSGMWGDEFIVQYNPETNEGNGFILEDITPKELYDAFSVVSNIYYDFINNNNTRFLDFRKRIYEDAKILYIENMTMRYIYEIFLPAIRCKRTEDSIRQTAKMAHLPGKEGRIESGEALNISATILLDDTTPIDSIEAHVWTDIDSSGDWYALDMDVAEISSKTKTKVFKFNRTITPQGTGDFYYKVRFIVKENGREIYLPQGFGNNIRITVDLPDPEQAPKRKSLQDIDRLNRKIQSAA